MSERNDSSILLNLFVDIRGYRNKSNQSITTESLRGIPGGFLEVMFVKHVNVYMCFFNSATFFLAIIDK